MADRPDLKTFLTDPAFQQDRDLFTALIEDHLTKKEEAAKKKKEEEEKLEKETRPRSIFDWS